MCHDELVALDPRDRRGRRDDLTEVLHRAAEQLRPDAVAERLSSIVHSRQVHGRHDEAGGAPAGGAPGGDPLRQPDAVRQAGVRVDGAASRDGPREHVDRERRRQHRQPAGDDDDRRGAFAQVARKGQPEPACDEELVDDDGPPAEIERHEHGEGKEKEGTGEHGPDGMPEIHLHESQQRPEGDQQAARERREVLHEEEGDPDGGGHDGGAEVPEDGRVRPPQRQALDSPEHHRQRVDDAEDRQWAEELERRPEGEPRPRLRKHAVLYPRLGGQPRARHRARPSDIGRGPTLPGEPRGGVWRTHPSSIGRCRTPLNRKGRSGGWPSGLAAWLSWKLWRPRARHGWSPRRRGRTTRRRDLRA